MHCKHLPARDDWVKQEYLQNAAQGEEVCLHMWLSLWPLTSTWGHSEYKRRETHNLQVPSLDLHSTPRALRFFQTIWPLRRSHGSHWEQFTSIRTYFRKPLIQNRNKAGLLPPPPLPSALVSSLLCFPLHPEIISTSKKSCSFPLFCAVPLLKCSEGYFTPNYNYPAQKKADTWDKEVIVKERRCSFTFSFPYAEEKKKRQTNQKTLCL